MPKKIDGLKKYFVLLNEKELEQAKQIAVKRDIRNLSIVGNTSGFIRYLVQQFIKDNENEKKKKAF